MTARLRTHPAPTAEHDPAPTGAAAETASTRPGGAGFVLYVGVDESFGTGPRALRELVEAAETLQELARDLLPTAGTHTTLSLTPPAA